MSRITEADYIAMQARLRKSAATFTPADTGPESALHDAILAHCRARRWLCVHSRMDRPTSQGLGVPDFIILADKGRMFLVEAKSKTGKLTPEQMGFGVLCELLGHKVHLVRSLKEFLEIVQ